MKLPTTSTSIIPTPVCFITTYITVNKNTMMQSNIINDNNLLNKVHYIHDSKYAYSPREVRKTPLVKQDADT